MKVRYRIKPRPKTGNEIFDAFDKKHNVTTTDEARNRFIMDLIRAQEENSSIWLIRAAAVLITYYRKTDHIHPTGIEIKTELVDPIYNRICNLYNRENKVSNQRRS